MTTIFISHAARDNELAEQIQMEIQNVFGLTTNDVFLSSKEKAIQKQDWKAVVETALCEAAILIPLITPCSIKSIWVGVEYGHFWAQQKVRGDRDDGLPRVICPLHIPKVAIPSPFDRDTSKSVMSEEALEAYFDNLCTGLRKPKIEKLNTSAIIEKVNRIHLLTAEEAKWQMEGKLYLNIAPTVDDKNVIIEWMKEAKILQGIDLKWNKNLNLLNFQDANLFRANLGGCELRGARFWGANLEEAKLGSAHLEGAELSHTTLTGTHFEAANLSGAILTGANFGGTHYLDLWTTLPDGRMYEDIIKRKEVLAQYGAIL